MDSKRDLGFFNGVKAELLPLIAGLVSFTLLVEEAVNHIESFLSIDLKASTKLFVIIYFVAPVIAVLYWITGFNYREGLKAIICEKRSHFFSIFVFVLLGLIVLLVFAFFLVPANLFGLLSSATILLQLIFLIFLSLRKRSNTFNFRRESKQAKMQMWIVFVGLITFWVTYYWRTFYTNDNKQYKAETKEAYRNALNDRLFVGSFDTALVKRKEYKKKDSLAKEFLKSYQRYAFRLNPRDCEACINLTLNFNDLVDTALHVAQVTDSCFCRPPAKKTHSRASTQNCEDKNRDRCTASTDFFTSSNSGLIRYYIDESLKAADRAYRTHWSAWLRTVQYRGLLLFLTVVLFFLLAWYYSYIEWLETDMKGDFSEINISKISVYILFLLTVPFFKPVTEENTVFDKPHVSFNNSLTYNTYNSPRSWGRDSIDWSKMPNPNQLRFDTLDTNLKSIKDSVVKLKADIERLKKEKTKPTKAYDEN